MAHITFEEWLQKYEVELWKEYWEDKSNGKQTNWSSFKVWAKDKWTEGGVYGGGS